MWNDVRHSLRMLAKNPGLTGLAGLPIAIGVGATPASVRRMVLREGLTLTAAGTLVGLIASYGVSGALRAALPFPEVPPFDLTTDLIVVPVLAVVASWAAFVPACRASRIDPLVAVRRD
jgi:putative ABC transport system permease protein